MMGESNNEGNGQRHSVATLLVMLLVLPSDPFKVGFGVRVKGAAIRAHGR